MLRTAFNITYFSGYKYIKLIYVSYIFTPSCGMQYERLLAAGRFFSGSGRASLLTSFGFGGGLFERLGNVLDSEAWALFLSIISG